MVALKVSLDHYKLQSPLPKQVCHLKKLRMLFLVSPTLSDIPACLYDLPELADVVIHGSENMSSASMNVSSSVIHQLATHKGMKRLELASVDLTPATFNSIFSELQTLEELTLIDNHLSTTIPPALCSLSKLVYLKIASNNLQGEIPACFSNLTRLESLSLPENNLHGSIQHLKDLSRLSTLEVPDNQLSGPFPDFVCNTTVIFENLSLSNNNFKSRVPECISFIHTVTLDKNQFYGSLPSSLFSTNTSIFIDLSHNAFTGPLPRIRGASQVFVVLSHNFLTGTLTSLDWILAPSLSTLDLSSNMLTGPIPATLAN